jgi:hypothetical protein
VAYRTDFQIEVSDEVFCAVESALSPALRFVDISDNRFHLCLKAADGTRFKLIARASESRRPLPSGEKPAGAPVCQGTPTRVDGAASAEATPHKLAEQGNSAGP